MTYADFSLRIKKLTQMRLRNYSWTNDDLNEMIEFIYNDITNEIRLEWDTQSVLISSLTEIYDITNAENSGIYDAYDEDNYSVFPFMELRDENTLAIPDQKFLDRYNGKTIYIVRKHKPAVANADPRVLDKILKACIEGIVYFVQDGVVSQMDEQGANFHYQRYYNERKKLIELNPQMGSPAQTNSRVLNFQ